MATGTIMKPNDTDQRTSIYGRSTWPASNTSADLIRLFDADGQLAATVRIGMNPDYINMQFYVRKFINNDWVNNGITFNINKTGSVSVSFPSDDVRNAFRTALGIN